MFIPVLLDLERHLSPQPAQTAGSAGNGRCEADSGRWHVQPPPLLLLTCPRML